MPKVSVCIPVYNGERFIRQAVDSVLGQTYGHFELVIVDNRSTDSTFDILSSYADPRIRLFRNDRNIGMIPNWNEALGKATGDYLKILPADDIIYPRCLELQAAVLDGDRSKSIAMVCGWKNLINENDRVLLKRGFSRRDATFSGKQAINRNTRSGSNIIGEGGSVLFRREAFEKAGPFDSPLFYTLDIHQWYKMLLHGDLYSIAGVVSAFRVSTVSESTRAKNTQLHDLRVFFNEVYRDKRFGLSWVSLQVGLLNAFLITVAKKVLYRLLLRP